MIRKLANRFENSFKFHSYHDYDIITGVRGEKSKYKQGNHVCRFPEVNKNSYTELPSSNSKKFSSFYLKKKKNLRTKNGHVNLQNQNSSLDFFH